MNLLKKLNNQNLGNGTLMRISPVPIAFHNDINEGIIK